MKPRMELWLASRRGSEYVASNARTLASSDWLAASGLSIARVQRRESQACKQSSSASDMCMYM
jgi:hypothetical protein